MAITVLIPSAVSFVAIAIMISLLVIAYIKKFAMTFALIIANFIVFFITLPYWFVIYELGFQPAYLSLDYFPQIYTIFTSMFIHGGIMHIIGNMFILFLIGLPFEQRVGWKKFLLIYMLAGICGTLTHAFTDLSSTTPLIGASGAIFGIMGAFAVSYPNDKVLVPIGYIIAFLVRIKVLYAVIFYALIETVIIYWEARSGLVSSTAHFAHVGGLIGGGILAWLLINRNRRETGQSNQTIYYDSYSPQRSRKFDISSLKKLAKTSEQKEILARIEQENIPQVREAWIEHFLDKAMCPKCGKNLQSFNGKIWCDNCSYKTKY